MSKLEQIRDRITDYLGNGGLFNPELMEPEKVRDLLMDVREVIDDLLKRSSVESLLEKYPYLNIE